MAMTFYNKFTNSSDADSAGTEVHFEGETLQERRDRKGGVFVIDAMAKEGLDVKNNVQTQVTKDMIKRYDKVICMAQPELTPAWLENASNCVRWNVDDPGGKGLEETNKAKEIIKSKVAELIRINLELSI